MANKLVIPIESNALWHVMQLNYLFKIKPCNIRCMMGLLPRYKMGHLQESVHHHKDGIIPAFGTCHSQYKIHTHPSLVLACGIGTIMYKEVFYTLFSIWHTLHWDTTKSHLLPISLLSLIPLTIGMLLVVWSTWLLLDLVVPTWFKLSTSSFLLLLLSIGLLFFRICAFFKEWWIKLFFCLVLALYSWLLTLTLIEPNVLTLITLLRLSASFLVLWFSWRSKKTLCSLSLFFWSQISHLSSSHWWDYLASQATCWYVFFPPCSNSSMLQHCECWADCSQWCFPWKHQTYRDYCHFGRHHLHDHTIFILSLPFISLLIS